MTNLSQQHKYCFHTPGSCTHTPLLGVTLVCSLAPMTVHEPKEHGNRGSGSQKAAQKLLAAQKLQQQQQQQQNDSWHTIQKPAGGNGRGKGKGKGQGKGQGGKGSNSKGKGSKGKSFQRRW